MWDCRSFERFPVLCIGEVPGVAVAMAVEARDVVDGPTVEGSVVAGSAAPRAAVKGAADTQVSIRGQGGIILAEIRHAVPVLQVEVWRQRGVVVTDDRRHLVRVEVRRQGGVIITDDRRHLVPIVQVEVWGQRGVVAHVMLAMADVVVPVGDVVVHDVVDDVELALADVLRHTGDDGLRQPIARPCPGAALLFVVAAPAFLGFGPTKMPVFDAGMAVVVALVDYMLDLRDGDLLVDGLRRQRHGHRDDLPGHVHRNGYGLVAVLRRRWHRLRHVVLVCDVLVDHVRRASLLDLDHLAGVLAGSSKSERS